MSRKTEEAESETFCKALLSNRLFCAVIANELKIESASDSFLTLSGFTEEELRKQKLSELFHYEEQDRIDFSTLLEMSGEIPRAAMLLRLDGLRVPVEISSSSYESENHNKRLVLISDLANFTSSQNIKRHFLDKVSSDLRSPLASLAGSLALIQSNKIAKLPESLKNVVTIAIRNCNRLTLMINDIIERERLESGKIVLQTVKSNLPELVENAVRLTRGYSEDKAIEIVMSMVDFQLDADHEKLTQALAVLLRSAITTGTRESTIAISIESSAAEAFLRITSKRDSSSPPADVDQLDINADFTTLSIDLCKEIIKLHDGELTTEYKTDGSFEYQITLPASIRSNS